MSNGLTCPYCGSRTQVIESKADPIRIAQQRRRQCVNEHCKSRHTTIEVRYEKFKELVELDKVKMMEELFTGADHI